MRQKTYLLALALVSGLISGTPLAAQVSAQTTAADNFSYNGDLGPGFWNEISPACATSPVSRQSPIDIDDAIEDRGLRPLRLFLSETRYTLSNPGYTVEAAPHTNGVLVLRGEIYKLVQFHFHTLSEHTVEGRRGEMELHAVFRNERSELAVIGVIYKIGASNPFLAKLLAAGIPPLTSSPKVEVEKLNLAEGLTDTSSYFTYAGSLTTPKCTENVTWIVLKRWAEMSPEQFEAFRHVLGNDFRPLQKRNDRVIRATAR